MLKRGVAIIAALALLLLPAVVGAEEHGGRITWLAYSTVVSGKTGDAVKLFLEDREFYDGLMADGTILSWGLATPINHRPDDSWNHLAWVSVENWAKVGAWSEAFQKHLASRSAEKRDELMKMAEATYEPGSHFDEVVRQVVFSGLAEDATPPRYFYVGNHTAKPGQAEAATQLFKEVAVPVADRLKSEGSIGAYGLQVSDLHGDRGWTHRAWYALPDLGAIDKLMAAFGEVSNQELQRRIDGTFDLSAHSDQVLLILHLGGSAQE